MKKKLLTLLVILTLALSLAVPAMAAGAPGSSTVNDNDGENGTTVVSTGAVTLTADGIDDETLSATKPHTADNSDSQDIDVQARINEADAKIRYVVDIAWGGMNFVYNRESQVWDPVTHKYVTSPSSSDGWLTDNSTITGGTASETYLITEATPTKTISTTTNNKIVVTNHSNAAIDAKFTYAVDATNGGGISGGFYATSGGAISGSAVTTGNTFNTLASGEAEPDRTKVFLYTGVGRNPASNDLIWAPVYFSLSGAPTATTLTNFQKVGTITVTIAPIPSSSTRFATFNTAGTDQAW